MQYASKVLSSEGGKIRYIRAIENGKRAWYMLELYPESYADYKKRMKTGQLLLTDFGQIIARGWGDKAPVYVLERYGIPQ